MREFIDRYPTGQVVNLACGLDTRFHRVALGSKGTRFEVDLEPVMALRDLLLGSPDGVRVVSSSVLNQGWMESLESDRPTLIIAEGLLMYLNTSEMRQLILSILHRLPGAEWVSDVVHRRWVRSPLSWLTSVNLHLRWGFGKEARFQSGLGSSKEMEAWNDELEFLGDWSFFDEPPSPLGWIRGFRRIRTLRSALWIIHYRLGCRAEGQGAV
jgi:O-methyltransferase involved in polyketide biosynthesis